MRCDEAIFEWTGVRMLPPPEDGVMRSFRIDQLRNGFVIAIGGLWAIGSIIDGEIIIFDGRRCLELEYRHKRSKKIAFEWCVWEAGRVAIENAIVLSREDSERLALAVKRLEGWL